MNEQLGVDLFFYNKLQTTQSKSIKTIDKIENVKQAVYNRLRTRRGELFGHTDYGTDLYTLIGKPITATNIKLAKLYFLEGIIADPRIDRVVNVSATTDLRKNMIQLYAKGVTIDGFNSVNLVYPFFV
jgi:phage baseplate assembly protein W